VGQSKGNPNEYEYTTKNQSVGCILLLIAVLCTAQTNSGSTPATRGASQAMSARYEDLMWLAMVHPGGVAGLLRMSRMIVVPSAKRVIAEITPSEATQ
jgi:hypothetical protein